MGILHLKEAGQVKLKLLEERGMPGGAREILTSEDLHCSLMFKIWITLHKNKCLPLSLLWTGQSTLSKAAPAWLCLVQCPPQAQPQQELVLWL